MTETEAYTEIRDLLGGVSEQEISNRLLRTHLARALEWLAQQLGTALEEDSHSFQAEAGRQEYPLPPHVNQLKWIYWNGTFLHPTTTDQWLSDNFNWKGANAGYPDEFAVEGRKLIFSCAFSSDAATSAPTITYKYTRSSRGQRPATMPDVPDSDASLACTYAAFRWCVSNQHLDGVPAKMAGLKALVDMDLKDAQARTHQPIERQQPDIQVFTGRAPTAR